jgi:hypothetical protein
MRRREVRRIDVFGRREIVSYSLCTVELEMTTSHRCGASPGQRKKVRGDV